MKTLGALTVRKKFGSIIDEVANQKEHIAISRANKPLVVMIPIEEYEKQCSQRQRQRELQLVSEKIDKWRKDHREKVKGINSTQIIRQMRDSR